MNEAARRSLALRAAAAAALLLVFLAACSTQDASPVAPGSSTGSILRDFELQVLATVNAHRASLGLPSLAWNDAIGDQARQHSASMSAGTTPFGHDGFNDRVAVIGQTVPWSDAAEIVAVMPGQSNAAAVVNAWLDSPEHKVYVEG